MPVVALKVGRTEAAAAAALTHTGAVAGSDAAYAALFDRCGVLRVGTHWPRIAAPLLLLCSPVGLAAPGGVVAIHDSGRRTRNDSSTLPSVPGSFAAITARDPPGLGGAARSRLAAEIPLDAWGTGEEFRVSLFAGSFSDLLADPNAALGPFCADFRDDYYMHGICAGGQAPPPPHLQAGRDRHQKPYTRLCHDRVALDLTGAGVPVLDGAANGLAAARAARACAIFWPRRGRPASARAGRRAPGSRGLRPRRRPAGAWRRRRCSICSAAFGIPTAPHARSRHPVEAVVAAARPRVSRGAEDGDPGTPRNPERSNVALDLRHEAAAREACGPRMAPALGPRVMLARMFRPDPELAHRARCRYAIRPSDRARGGRDAGGAARRPRRRAAAVRLRPLRGACSTGCALRPLLDGFRGGPATDLAALADLVARFSVLVRALASVLLEIDVDPSSAGHLPPR